MKSSTLTFLVPTWVIHVPWLQASGMALYPFILVKKKHPSAILLNHERIHLCQQLELGLVVFYIWYIAEYLWYRYYKGESSEQAYLHIRFEQEAYRNDEDLTYLRKRKCWRYT